MERAQTHHLQDPQRALMRRAAAGLSQVEAAGLIRRAPATLSRIENGRCGASVETLRRMAAAYHCKITDLMPPLDDADKTAAPVAQGTA